MQSLSPPSYFFLYSRGLGQSMFSLSPFLLSYSSGTLIRNI